MHLLVEIWGLALQVTSACSVFQAETMTLETGTKLSTRLLFGHCWSFYNHCSNNP